MHAMDHNESRMMSRVILLVMSSASFSLMTKFLGTVLSYPVPLKVQNS